MKKKLPIIITVVILVAFAYVCLNNDKELDQPQMDSEVLTTQTTENVLQETSRETDVPVHTDVEIIESTENTESTRETWSVEVVESTPNKITMEVEDKETGKKIEIQMGGEEADHVPDEDDDSFAGLQKPAEHNPIQPKPAEPKPTEPKPAEPKPTEPKPTEAKPAQPSGNVTKVEKPGSDVTFEDYESMTGEEQMLFYYTFADADAFNAWYDAAKAVYDANKGDIIIGEDGVINLG